MRKYKSQKDVRGQFCRIRESIAPIHEYSVFALEQLSSPFRLTVTIRQKDFSQSVQKPASVIQSSESQLDQNLIKKRK